MKSIIFEGFEHEIQTNLNKFLLDPKIVVHFVSSHNSGFKPNKELAYTNEPISTIVVIYTKIDEVKFLGNSNII